MLFRASTTFLTLLLTALPCLAFTVETNPETEAPSRIEMAAADNTTESIPTLQQVTVIGLSEAPLTVSDTLSREQLDKLPQKNGSINETLGVLPGVQLGDFHRTSDNAGEILPPDLSISGGRTYENNFTIDGFGNNSLLDPTYRDIDNNDNVPGHPQQNFLHPSLVEKITVYRSNVPARYGNFTGGVVDVETRDPSGTFGGEITLRHSRSEWTNFHKDSSRREEYNEPVAGGVQPKFRKYDGSILLDIPITEQTGIIASYSLVHSKIPLYQIKVPSNTIEEQAEYRDIENFFLKAVTHLSARTKLSLIGTFSPYQADYFKSETVDGGYTLENLAYGVTSKLEHRTQNAEIILGLGYTLGTNSRQAPNSLFNWKVTEAKPWGAVTDAGQKNQYSKEGGLGDVEKEQETLTANLHVTVDPVGRGALQHNVSFGLNYEQSEGRYDRPEDFTNYTVATQSTDVLCDASRIDCIDNEQFMYFKSIYPADKAEIRINFYDAYIEDQINVGQLTFRPGVRISGDDLQDNLNTAPRFAAGYDLFGDGRTSFYAGYNRYYGKTLMTHALSEQKADSQNWTRSTELVDDRPQEWQLKPRTSIPAVQLSELKTPYADELVFGLDQALFGGQLNLNYLEREGKDELATRVLEKNPETGRIYTEWSNDGRSKHKEASISWERAWRTQSLSIATTWQETETSNSDYADKIALVDKNDDGNADPVWYHGSVLDRSDLPRPDFNRTFVGNLIYSAKLPFNTTFTNVTRYRSGYKALEDSKQDIVLPSGLSYDIYEEVKQPESWLFDWRLQWESRILHSQALIMSMEINNIFNQRIPAGNSDNSYELGRQFWLGATYKF